MTPLLDISVVLPVLDEGAKLELLLPELQEALEGLALNSETIVVDTSCSDRIREIAGRFSVEYLAHEVPGYGAAVMGGAAEARGRYVLLMDPDAACAAQVLGRLWDARNDADVVVASRYVPGSRTDQPFLRGFLSRAMNSFFSRALSTPVRDLSSGFRLYRREVFERVTLDMKSLAFLPESLLKLCGNGILVKEVPFNYKLHDYRYAQAHGLRLGIECTLGLLRLWRMRNSVECADYDLRAFDSRIPLQRYWQRKRYSIVMGFTPPGLFTLDAGCGSGRLIADLPHAFGVDIRYEKVHFMRRSNPLLANANGLALPFADGAFECVISSEVIEHIPKEDGRFIDELTRVLKPGGTLVLGTPDYGTLTWRITERLYAMVAPSAYAHDHVTHYTHETLSKALTDRGYEILDEGYVCNSIVIFQARKKASA